MKHRTFLLLLGMFCMYWSCSESATESQKIPTGWEVQKPGTMDELVDVFFYDSHYGWVLSKFDGMGRTTNGGKTWTWDSGLSEKLHYATEVYFSDWNTGWALTQGGQLYHSVDGGLTWEENKYYEYYPFSRIRHIQFVDAQHGWFHDDENLFRTVDGGNTWTHQELMAISTPHRLEDIFFIDEQRGWAVGSGGGHVPNGTLISTVDGGEHWQKVDIGELPDLFHLHFVDATTGWVAGNRQIFRTTDGGNTWTELPNEQQELILDITFADNETGWFITRLPNLMAGSADNPIFSYTLNGGATWFCPNKTITSHNAPQMRALHFIDTKNGWAAGTQGTLWHTTTGGLPE